MNIEKQQLLLEYLGTNANLWNRCQNIVKPEYWDIELRPAVEFIIKYNLDYKALPDQQKIKAETGIVIESHVIGGDTFDYASHEVETFCRNKAVEHAIRKAPALLEKQDFAPLIQNLKDAILINLDRDIGLDYFDDVEARLRAMLENNQTISTGWESVDRIMGGGLTKKEMLMYLGTSGAGKSIVMLNNAKCLMEQGLNGVYYTLELSEEVVAQRLDMMISGVNFSEILKRIDYVAPAVTMQKNNMGKLLIKQYPASTTTALDLASNIKEIELEEGFTPDFIVIDYLDLMAPIAKVARDNLFISEKYIAEEVRNLAFEFDTVVITASQMNRSAINAETHDHSMISGGISKINTAGWVISISQNEIMKAAGEMLFQFLKTRSSNGVNSRIYMDKEPTSQVISCSTRENPSINSVLPPTDMDAVNQQIIAELAKNKEATSTKLKGMFEDD